MTSSNEHTSLTLAIRKGPVTRSSKVKWARYPEGSWGAPRNSSNLAGVRSQDHPVRDSKDAWRARVKYALQSIDLLDEAQAIDIYERKAQCESASHSFGAGVGNVENLTR